MTGGRGGAGRDAAWWFTPAGGVGTGEERGLFGGRGGYGGVWGGREIDMEEVGSRFSEGPYGDHCKGWMSSLDELQ